MKAVLRNLLVMSIFLMGGQLMFQLSRPSEVRLQTKAAIR